MFLRDLSKNILCEKPGKSSDCCTALRHLSGNKELDLCYRQRRPVLYVHSLHTTIKLVENLTTANAKPICAALAPSCVAPVSSGRTRPSQQRTSSCHRPCSLRCVPQAQRCAWSSLSNWSLSRGALPSGQIHNKLDQQTAYNLGNISAKCATHRFFASPRLCTPANVPVFLATSRAAWPAHSARPRACRARP